MEDPQRSLVNRKSRLHYIYLGIYYTTEERQGERESWRSATRPAAGVIGISNCSTGSNCPGLHPISPRWLYMALYGYGQVADSDELSFRKTTG